VCAGDFIIRPATNPAAFIASGNRCNPALIVPFSRARKIKESASTEIANILRRASKIKESAFSTEIANILCRASKIKESAFSTEIAKYCAVPVPHFKKLCCLVMENIKDKVLA
jgi:hypothetical protein